MGNAGGLSGARLWRFDSVIGLLVARRWPEEWTSREHVERIAGWLARADRLPFVPIPIKARDGRPVQEAGGTLWAVEPWKAGAAATSPSPERVRSAFAAIARFHLAMGEVTPGSTSPGLASRVREIGSLIAGDLDSWTKIVNRAQASRARDLARRWLMLAARLAPVILPEARRAASTPIATQPVIRDARPEHLLFEGDRVSGLVDFGAMGRDAVSTDLARLLGEWFAPGSPMRTEARTGYESARPLSPEEEAMIPVFERTAALLLGSRWVRWGLIEPRAFDDTSTIERGLTRAIERIERTGT